MSHSVHLSEEPEEKEERELIEHPIEIHWPYGGENVKISGYFNNWIPQKMHRQPQKHHHEYHQEATDHEGIMVFYVGPLQPGKYQYRFLLNDKEWRIDPSKPTVVGADGIMNNSLTVE